MAQLTYENQAAAIRGMLASDTENRSVESMVAKEIIPVGVGVSKVIGKDGQVRLPSANQGSLDFAGDLVTSNVINLKVNGSAISPVTFLTDHATTMGLIAAAIALKTTYVSAATVGTARQIVVKGLDDVDVLITDIVVTAGATQTTGAFTQGTRDNLYGLALLTQILEGGLPGSNEVPSYAANDVVNTVIKGSVYCYFETAFNPDIDTLYLRFLAGSAATELPGNFRNTADSGKAIAVTGNVKVKQTISVAGIAIVEVNKPN